MFGEYCLDFLKKRWLFVYVGMGFRAGSLADFRINGMKLNFIRDKSGFISLSIRTVSRFCSDVSAGIILFLIDIMCAVFHLTYPQ